ncbi:hypothetical protein DRN74_04695 [Candidatus Micrarchaeota archaeon]|nr:MAG: hypothetical protein DRN74_04695 [Candidatus Micrarchaeota archaeon]
MKEVEEEKSRMVPLPKEEYSRIVKDYPLKPLPKKYYKDQRGGVAWCFASPRTKVLTEGGWKPWNKIYPGERVLTHKGRFMRVTRKDAFEGIYDWIKVHLQFDNIKDLKYDIRVTENHPFLTTEGWKEAKDLKVGDKIASKTPKRCLNCRAPIPLSWNAKTDFMFCSDECARNYEWTEESLHTEYIDKQIYDNPLADVTVTVVKIERIKIPKNSTVWTQTHACSLEVEEDHSYMTPLGFSHNSQWHIRGIKPEDKEAFDKGEISFEEMILRHSLHQDLRWKLNGVSVLPQCTITESDMKSYVRGMLGQLNPEQKGPANVQKVKVIPKVEVAKPTMPKSKIKEFLIDKEGAKLINKIIIHETSYWISPGEIGSLPYTWAYMGTVWTGKVATGDERGDFHELFFYPDKDLPEPNRKFFDGRFILRAFRGEAARGGKTWWLWKSTKNPYPQNPWCYCDQGEHEVLPLDKIKHWGHEDYPEWKTRKDDCE